MAVLPIQQYDRLPFVSLESPVDSSCFNFDLRIQIVISLQMAPAWSSDLNKRELPLISGVLFEEAFNSEETFQDAFGVIDTVHANSQEQCFQIQTLEQGRARVGGGFCRGITFEIRVDADGERLGHGAVPETLHREMFPVNSGLHHTIGSFEEIIAVCLKVKSDQVRA